ncbi:hypothetical protein VaNZ11_013904 [Volvox africanus]|uniref:Uncharacterized protein n=1 Tax=Volvox africanus TaxID=51714 RepID=A0ABQ5SIU1_9CHLO|nr:hypothetical protein VaNZ11_013904 [Volvox africanus]
MRMLPWSYLSNSRSVPWLGSWVVQQVLEVPETTVVATSPSHRAAATAAIAAPAPNASKERPPRSGASPRQRVLRGAAAGGMWSGWTCATRAALICGSAVREDGETDGAETGKHPLWNVAQDKLFDRDWGIRQLLAILAGLSVADCGRFIAWDGRDLPWVTCLTRAKHTH